MSTLKRAPWPLVALGGLGAAVFVVPLAGLASKVPWGNLAELVTSPVVVDALKLSLITSLSAASISLLLGVPLAWLLARGLGLWDVYASCDRQGSLDASIRNPQANDFPALAQHLPRLAAVAHNGGESFRHARHVR